MEEYQMIEELGTGSFGTVFKSKLKITGEIVAIKRFNNRVFNTWEECTNVSEVRCLISLKHRNIVQIKGVIRDKNCELFVVFEYIDCSLYRCIKDISLSTSHSFFTENQIRNIMYQLLTGLKYIHKNGFVHRDLKPENILYSGERVVIADFGLSINIKGTGNHVSNYSSYVATRWYRAPELLLKLEYGFPVDIWAAGCIFAELFSLEPLFPGDNIKYKNKGESPVKYDSGNDQDAIGTFHPRSQKVAIMEVVFPTASLEAIQLLCDLLTWEPSQRPTAKEALTSKFFCVNSLLNQNFDHNL